MTVSPQREQESSNNSVHKAKCSPSVAPKTWKVPGEQAVIQWESLGAGSDINDGIITRSSNRINQLSSKQEVWAGKREDKISSFCYDVSFETRAATEGSVYSQMIFQHQ